MYVESSPTAALGRAVECCWRLHADRVTDHAVRPDGCIDIVYSRDMGLRAVGAMTSERRISMPAGSTTIGIRFRPGMAKPFLRVSPSELTDRNVPLEDLWGARARGLERQLECELSEQALTLALHAAPTPDPVKRALEAVAQSHGAIDLDWVAAQAAMSPRQFRRRCLDESGLAPKHLCRILRFRRACELAAQRAHSWAAIAADAGYFDQAHLIRDFHEFTGQPPMSVFSNPPASIPIQNRA
jgi:AraC-like DNA-binding protein